MRGAGRFRHSRRGQNHSAQLDGAAPIAHAVPDHPLICKDDPELVTTDEGVRELVRRLRDAGRFAYDTEFIGELSFFPRLCLIQVATESVVALVDPLEPIDLTPIWELIADGSVEKIVHSGLQDLEPVVRHLDRPPVNIFDTQIAAGFVGEPYPAALAHLVKAFVGVNLGKGLTFTHWDHRPLSQQHMRYAVDDVRYLPALRHVLREALDRAGHEAWCAQECAALSDVSLYRPDIQNQYLRVRGTRAMKRKELAILRELVIWRDQAARHEDVPPRTLAKDEVLIAMCKRPPRSESDLRQLRFMANPVVDAYGQQILDAIAQAQQTPAAELPHVEQVDDAPQHRIRIDALWSAATCICHGRGVDPALVTSRQEIARVYHQSFNGGVGDDLRLMRAWRGELLGSALRRFLAGDAEVKLQWRDGAIRATL